MRSTKVVLTVVLTLLSAAWAQTRRPGQCAPASENGTRPATSFDGARVAALYSVRSMPVPEPTSCPRVDVSCPDAVTAGTPVIFTANISGADPAVTPTFKWTVSSGTITSGQGTSSITVDTSGAARQSVTGVVEVGGYHPVCRMSASCTLMPGLPPVARKVDEYGVIPLDDEKARLNNIYEELRKDPTALGYLICYGGRSSRPDDASRRCDRAWYYLGWTRDIPGARVMTINGGLRREPTVEFWMVPPGAQPPQPTPHVFPGESKPPAPARKRGRRTRR